MPAKLSLFTFSCLALVLIGNNSFAQRDGKPNTLKQAEFIIEKEKANQLPESTRLFKKAPIPLQNAQTNLPIAPIAPDITIPFTLLAPAIKVRKDQQPLLPFSFNRYLALGHGNHWSPYLDLFLHNTTNPRYGYGLHLHHLSEGKNSYGEKYEHQASLHGKMLTINNLALASQISYAQDRHPYSQQDKKEDKNDSTRYEVYQQIKINNQLYNEPSDTLHYDLNNEIIYFKNNQKAQETQTTFLLDGTYYLNDTLSIQSGAKLHVNAYTPQHTRLVTSIQPTGIISFNDYILALGINLAYQNDTTALPKSIYIYPAIELTYHWNKSFIPYLGISGNLQQQTWHGYSTQNPYLVAHPTIQHTNQAILLSLGGRSDLPEQITNHVGIAVAIEENVPFFVNDSEEPRCFAITYDPSATTCKLFESLLKESFDNTLLTRLDLSYFYYKLTNLPHPWHRPTYTIALHNSYTFREKIVLKNTCYWSGGRKALDPTNQTNTELPDVVDLSLGIEYKWNERFSILLDAANLLARDNLRYLHTPTDGFHLWLGVSYGF